MTHDPSIPPIPDISNSFQQLKVAAKELNAVSDTLGQSILALDAALKRLNLGISSWVKIEGEEDEDGSGGFWSHDLGYSKIRGTWGIALRYCVGNYSDGDFRTPEQWLFGDAPRALRVKAVEKLPELLEGLTKEARATAAKIADKIGCAEQVVAAVTGKPTPGQPVNPRFVPSKAKPPITPVRGGTPYPPPTSVPYPPSTPTPDPPSTSERKK